MRFLVKRERIYFLEKDLIQRTIKQVHFLLTRVNVIIAFSVVLDVSMTDYRIHRVLTEKLDEAIYHGFMLPLRTHYPF